MSVAESEYQFEVVAEAGGYDLKPVEVALELLCEPATGGAVRWQGAAAAKRVRKHPHTGLPFVLVFPGEEYRVTLRNHDGEREILAALYVDGKLSGDYATVLPPRGVPISLHGWTLGAEVQPFKTMALPTVERPLAAAEVAAVADSGTLRIKVARRVMLAAPEQRVVGGGGGGGAVGGAPSLSSIKKIENYLSTQAPAQQQRTLNVSSTMGAIIGQLKIDLIDDYGTLILLKDKADLPPTPAIVVAAISAAASSYGTSAASKRAAAAAGGAGGGASWKRSSSAAAGGGGGGGGSSSSAAAAGGGKRRKGDDEDDGDAGGVIDLT